MEHYIHESKQSDNNIKNVVIEHKLLSKVKGLYRHDFNEKIGDRQCMQRRVIKEQLGVGLYRATSLWSI